jgi:hypothetical protein
MTKPLAVCFVIYIYIYMRESGGQGRQGGTERKIKKKKKLWLFKQSILLKLKCLIMRG